MRPITIVQKQQIMKCRLTNTCAFDCIVQVVTSVYMDSSDYANNISKSSGPTLKLAIRLAEQGDTAQFYEERLIILKDNSTNN